MEETKKIAPFNPQLGLGCLLEGTAALVPVAIKNGITFFDTANIYDNGKTEVALGKAFGTLSRERFHIATKCGCTLSNNTLKINSSKENILASCQKSLTALNLNYIDLYYLHRVDPKIPIETSMEAFKQLLTEGKIKHVGLSEVTPSQIRRAHAICPISAVQIEYSPWSRHDEKNGVIETCRELGITLVTYSPLGRAFFTSEFNGQLDESDYRNNIDRYKTENIDYNIKLRNTLTTFVESNLSGVSLSQFILAWQIHKGFIPIPSTTTLKHLEENCASTALSISPQIFDKAEALFSQLDFHGKRYASPKSSRVYNGIPFIPKNNNLALLSADLHVTGIKKITYEQLHLITDQLAAELSQHFKPKSVIAVYLPNSLDYVFAMLAIWKAGMIYFPLKNNEPLNQAQIQKAKGHLLNSVLYEELRKSSETPPPFRAVELCDHDWAYYIASSGTTSTPKIIRIRFESLMPRIRDHQQRMDIRKKNSDVMMAILNCAFDASIMEMLSALTKGIPLFVAPESIRENVFNLPELFSLAHREGHSITTGIFVPSILKSLSPEKFPGLKSFLATGEAFENAEQVQTWLNAGIKIFNGYGPTEITFGASIVQITDARNIPLFFDNNNGIFSGLVCLCLTKEGDNPESKWTLWNGPEGEGEVFLTGYEGLGEYVDDPERNQKSFIPREKYPDYFDTAVIEKIKDYPRVYRVCDVVRRHENRFLHVRRSDRIIKRAGKQVDLEEIETAFVKKFPGLSITIIYHNKLIRAFITSQDIPHVISRVSELLCEKPNIYYRLDKNTFEEKNRVNGKLKKTFDSLTPYAKKILPTKPQYTPTQEKVAKIWEHLFDNEEMNISIDDDFTENLGGESLLRMEMTNIVWEELLDKNIREQSTSTHEFSKYIHKNKTIRKIAGLVDACNKTFLDCDEDDIFSFKPDAFFTEENETTLVSAILQIRRQQKMGPYILFCSNKNQLSLYEKLKAQLEESQQVVYLASEVTELKHHKNERTRQRLLDKLKKTQQIILDEKLPQMDSIELESSCSTVITGQVFSGKTTALKRLVQSFWPNPYSEDENNLVRYFADRKIALYFSLKNGKITAIQDWLTQWLEPHEIEFLRENYAVVLLLDDYDLLARDDFPDLRLPSSEWPKITYLIASRTKHLDIAESREPFREFKEIILPKRLEKPSPAGKKISTISETAQANQELPTDASQTFVSIVEGKQAKPIFAFAPITGDATEYYRKLSTQLGFQQPFYVFILPPEGLGRSVDLNERAAYYAKIIQAKYPNGEMILLGWSFGALQAYATARILQQQNRAINVIINIDSAWPTDLSGFNVSQQLEKMKPRLDEIYIRNLEGRDSGIENTRHNLETYFQFMQQELANPHQLSVPMIIYKAEKTDTGLTEKPEFKWPCEIAEGFPLDIKDCDHFTIFKQPRFIRSITTEVNKRQPVASDKPLEKRLGDYVKKRFEQRQLMQTETEIPLFVSLYPISQTEPQLASEILECDDKNKTIILCGIPGAGKSTTLKNLEYVALEQDYIPVFIKLKEYFSRDTITQKLLHVGLNLQEIATQACKNLIFFLDGFDELDDKEVIGEIVSTLKSYAKIVISTRTHVYESLEEQLGSFLGSHVRYDLNSLTEEQIETLFENPDDYSFVLENHQLAELSKNPLTLSLIKKILPEFRENDAVVKSVTRYYIYSLFIKKLYTEREAFIKAERGIRPGFNMQQAFETYNRQKSLAAWKLTDAIFSEDRMTAQASRCDVTETHETFIEYYLANIIFDEIYSQRFYYSCKIDFSEKTSLVEFLCEKIQALEVEDYQKCIHLIWIGISNNKTPNLATLLNNLEVPFTGLSLRETTLEGADLSGAIFDRTHASNTSLKNVTLTNAYLSESSFKDSDLSDTNLGELPSVEHDEPITAFAVDSDNENGEKKTFYALATKKNILITQLGTPQFVKDLRLEENAPVTHLLLLPKLNVAFVQHNKIYYNQTELYTCENTILELRTSEKTDTLIFYTQDYFYTIYIPSKHVKKFQLKTDYKYVYMMNNENTEKESHAASQVNFNVTSPPVRTPLPFELFCVNQNNSLLAGTTTENSSYICEIYDTTSSEIITSFETYSKVLQLGFLAQKDFLCALTNDKEIILFDVNAEKVTHRIHAKKSITQLYLPDRLSIIGSLSHHYSYDFDMEFEVIDSTLHFHTLPPLGRPTSQKKIKTEKISVLHPEKPLIFHLIEIETLRHNKFLHKLIPKKHYWVEIQSITTKKIIARLKPQLPIDFKKFAFFKDNVYMLGIFELIIWNPQTETTRTIEFDEKTAWQNDIFHSSSPHFFFASESCFAIFDDEKIAIINPGKITTLSFKKTEWVHYVSDEKWLIGTAKNISIDTDDGEYIEITLSVFEWNPITGQIHERLNILSNPCSIEDSPLYELLDYRTDCFFIMGGGARAVYRCTLGENPQAQKIGGLPGYSTLKIDSSFFVCTKQERTPQQSTVAFYVLGHETTKINSFSMPPILAVHAPEHTEPAFDFQWNNTLQLLMVSGHGALSFWHIDIQQNCAATLLYDHRSMLEIRDMDFRGSTLNPLNRALLETHPTQIDSGMLFKSKPITLFNLDHENNQIFAGLIKDIWHLITTYFSYRDRLVFSQLSKHCYNLSHRDYLNRTFGVLLSTEDITTAKTLISSYVKQLLINLMTYPLDETQPIEIKPSKIAPNLLTIGFFAGSKKHTWDYPIKLLEKTSYFP